MNMRGEISSASATCSLTRLPVEPSSLGGINFLLTSPRRDQRCEREGLNHCWRVLAPQQAPCAWAARVPTCSSGCSLLSRI